MEEKKDGVIAVPAEIRFNEQGIVSFFFNFKTDDGSLLRKIIETKTVDDSKSVVGAFVREVVNAETKYLPKAWIVLSGMFNFTETPQRSKEEITAEALELAVLRLLDKDDDLCTVCARRETCTKESEEQGEAFEQPSCNVCVDNVIQYFMEKAKNGILL